MNWIDARSKQPDSERRVLLFDPTFDETPVHVGFWDGNRHTFELIDNGGWDGRAIGEVTHWGEMPDGPNNRNSRDVSS